jgi:DNA-binding NtrC family response regulator
MALRDRIRILCIACSASGLSTLERALKGSSYSVLTAATPDQGVAICVAQFVAAAIVDAESVRGKEWSVVKSLKLVRPSLPIILLDERNGGRNLPLPEGVDELVSITSLERLPDAINQLVRAIEQLPRP